MSNHRISHLEAIHITAAAATVLADANKLEGLKSFPLTITTEMAELKHHNSDGWSRYEAVWRTGSGSLSGDALKTSTTIGVLQAALLSGDSVFVHCIKDAAASIGSQGTMYELKVESGEEPHEAGALVTFSYAVKLNGPPVAI